MSLFTWHQPESFFPISAQSTSQRTLWIFCWVIDWPRDWQVLRIQRWCRESLLENVLIAASRSISMIVTYFGSYRLDIDFNRLKLLAIPCLMFSRFLIAKTIISNNFQSFQRIEFLILMSTFCVNRSNGWSLLTQQCSNYIVTTLFKVYRRTRKAPCSSISVASSPWFRLWAPEPYSNCSTRKSETRN